MIMECVCEHAFQDRRYGKHRRVMNPKADRSAARCTVCGREHSIRGASPVPPRGKGKKG